MGPEGVGVAAVREGEGATLREALGEGEVETDAGFVGEGL
jgi:hypothetical protein